MTEKIAWIVLAIAALHIIAMFIGFSNTPNMWYLVYACVHLPVIALAVITLVEL